MKVLIVSTFMPPYTGGAEQVAWEGAKRLARRKDLEVHLLTTGKEGWEIKDKVVIHRIPYISPLTLYYSTLGKKKIKNILEKNKFDVIHFHMPLPWGYVLRKLKTKKIITSHGEIEKVGIKHLMWYVLRRIALKKADLVTVPSNWMRENFNDKYKINAVVIPNGVDTKEFRQLKTKRERNTVLFVGRFTETKGMRELIEVAKELPGYNFWFAGKGELSSIINLPNTKNLGFKDKKGLVKLYNKAAICVFPFYSESFGMVGLEAMACGKAVVATQKGFSEFIENTKDGIIIEPRNKKQLKEAIVKLMEDNGLRKSLEKNARKKALNHSWEQAIDGYYGLYKGLSSKGNEY